MPQTQKKKKTSQFLRNCIFEALMLLLDNKKYDDITVSELADKAGVSRMTYYRTYSSKEDIVVQYLKEKTDKLAELFEKHNLSRRQWYLLFFRDVHANKEIAEKIFRTPQLCTAALEHFIEFSKHILKHYYNQDADKPEVVYKIMYQTGGFIFVTARWVFHGCDKSPEEMTDLLLKYEDNPAFIE